MFAVRWQFVPWYNKQLTKIWACHITTYLSKLHCRTLVNFACFYEFILILPKYNYNVIVTIFEHYYFLIFWLHKITIRDYLFAISSWVILVVRVIAFIFLNNFSREINLGTRKKYLLLQIEIIDGFFSISGYPYDKSSILLPLSFIWVQSLPIVIQDNLLI